MAIGRKPMCKKHPRQYAHTCTVCEQELKAKLRKEQEEKDASTNDTTVAAETE